MTKSTHSPSSAVLTAPIPAENLLGDLRRLVDALVAAEGSGLEPAETQILLGVIDRVNARNGTPLPQLDLLDGEFWNLRRMIHGSEFPSDDTNAQRMYLKLHPFDIGIQRTGEGVVADIWGGEEAGLDSLGSTYAFFSEAESGTEE